MKSTRREFITRTGVAAGGLSIGLRGLTAAQQNRVQGANERVRVGFIGVGNRGEQLLNAFMGFEDVEVAALCDVYGPYLRRDKAAVHPRYTQSGKVPGMNRPIPGNPRTFTDFRQLLDQKDIDAVVIATPDHWHCIQTILALQAGKDVYVEKPLSITLREGRMMVEAQKRTDRIVAVGLNRRGSSIYRELAGKVPEGLIGRVTTAQAQRQSNMFPDGIGRLQSEEPPADLDWDLWLGPRKHRPYQYNIAPYYFRWWSDYSTQMGNWGVHYMDAIRWLTGETAPTAVTAHGGKYVLTDDRDIPDTMEVLFEFKSGVIVRFSILEASNGSLLDGEIELRGTKGTLVASQDGYRVIPSEAGQFQTWRSLMEPVQVDVEGQATHGDLAIKEDSTSRLVRNFLDCVKSRATPWCPLEEGHRSTSFAHLANISLAVGERLQWDPEREVILNHPQANDLLHYEYREPWKGCLA